jgi:hypothetical protein
MNVAPSIDVMKSRLRIAEVYAVHGWIATPFHGRLEHHSHPP